MKHFFTNQSLSHTTVHSRNGKVNHPRKIIPGRDVTFGKKSMKTLTLLIILFPVGVFAQGNVGIGTTTPLNKLSILGNTTLIQFERGITHRQCACTRDRRHTRSRFVQRSFYGEQMSTGFWSGRSLNLWCLE